MLAGLAFFLAGLAHGACDEDNRSLEAYRPVRVAAYLLVAAALAAFFIMSPLLGLSAFLALSTWHFCVEDEESPAMARLATALVATGGSALFWPDTTAAVFASIAGAAIPQAWMIVLQVAGAGGVAAGAIAAIGWRGAAWKAILAIAAVIFFHPVLAVGLIFFVTHALPAQARQIADFGLPAVLKAVTLPVAVAATGAVAIVVLVAAGYVALPIAAGFAIGIATPHMLTTRLGHG